VVSLKIILMMVMMQMYVQIENMGGLKTDGSILAIVLSF
jgi:hypothetical protein